MKKNENEFIVDEKYSSSVNELSIEGFMNGEISPFDMPQKAYTSYDETSKTYDCRFEYLTDSEPVTSFDANGPYAIKLIFSFGKISGKLYLIKISNIERNEIPSIRLSIVTALNEKITTYAKDKEVVDSNLSRLLNYLSAKKFLDQEREIFKFA